MRKSMATFIAVLMLGAAIPAQASAFWFDPWQPSRTPDFSTTQPSWGWPQYSNREPESTNDSHSETVKASDERVEKIIDMGMKYRGTPYEFGSDRDNTRTFDCSDFVRHIFKEAVGVTLPTDSRKQGDYVRDLGGTKSRISDLKRGDLMFFMDYRGSDPGDYNGIRKSSERITHVGIYLGNGQILHTYSKESGGVRVDRITDTPWEYRFLFGGSALK